LHTAANNEPLQDLNTNIRLTPQARQQLLQILAPIEVDDNENYQQAALVERLNELEKQLQIEREKNREKTFSIFGQWQAGLEIQSSSFF